MVQFGASPALVVQRTVEVPVAPAVAFEKFTAEITRWWPRRTHSVGQERAQLVVLEARVGGRLYERLDDGTEHDWGQVRVWEPPTRFVTTWHPGSEDDRETIVEVRFEAIPGGTRVVLDHRGWEVFASDAEQLRLGYQNGWAGVLAEYTAWVDSSR